MKAIYYLFAASVAALTLSSCLFEEDDLFKESASQRVVSYNNDAQSVLVGQNQGWIMQYFPNPASGGYSIMTSFTQSGVCKAACIFAQKNADPSATSDAAAGAFTLSPMNPADYREASSLYTLEESNGPVLAMSSYNDIISGFVAPQDDGAGYGGDDHFVILKATAEEVLLKGARYGARIRMTPAQADWKEELNSIYTTNKDLFVDGVKSYYLMAGDSTFYCIESETGVLKIGNMMADRLNYNEPQFRNALTSEERSAITNNNATFVPSAQFDQVSFVPSKEGVRFQSAYEKSGVSGLTFAYNADSSALASENGKMKLVPTLERYMATHDEIWNLDTAQMTGQLKETYLALDSIMKAKSFTGVKIGFGRSTGASVSGNNVWGLIVNGSLTVKVGKKTQKIPVSLAIGYDVDATTIGENSLKLEEVQRDMNFREQVVEASGNVHVLYEPMMLLAKAFEGNYALSASNAFNPATVTYVAKSGDFSFTIVK